MKLKVGSCEYDNVKKISFSKYKGGLFRKNEWFADVVLVFENGEEYTARWGLERIELLERS